MPNQPLQGEITRHQNKSGFKLQPTGQHRLIWSGCLAPMLVIGMFIYLLIQGLQTDFGLSLIRGFIIFVVIFLLLQLAVGGGLFRKSPSGWRMTLLTNLSAIILLLMLALVGLVSLLQKLL